MLPARLRRRRSGSEEARGDQLAVHVSDSEHGGHYGQGLGRRTGGVFAGRAWQTRPPRVELGVVPDRDPYESLWSYALRKVRDLWTAESGQDPVEQRVFVTIISLSITLAVIAAGGTLFMGFTGRF